VEKAIELKQSAKQSEIDEIHSLFLACFVGFSINQYHSHGRNNGNEERSEIEESTRNAMHLETTSSLHSSTSIHE
jgi:hypothetical protein